MKCPHCNKEMYGMTGLQELQKFHKHLPKCRKNPANENVITPDGSIEKREDNSTMYDALEQRAASGQ